MNSDSIWQAITTSAVLGTQRRPVQFAETGSPLGDLLTEIQGGDGQPPEDRSEDWAEDLLLGALAAAAIHRRAGRLPQAGIPLRFPACPPDEWPRCAPRASVFLQAVLAGQQRALLAEWVELAALHRQRIPEEHLEAIFAHKRLLQPCRAAFSLVLGERGRWWVRQTSAVQGKLPPLGYGLRWEETIWHEGKSEARAEFLADLRLHDAQRALELLAESWPQETPTAKLRLLKALGESIRAEEEPFLESALADRSLEVRAAAAGLLARLPASRLAADMTARASAMLAWKTSLLRGTLVVTLPEECDAELRRAGIDLRPPAGSALGQQAGLLAQVLALVPPRVWSSGWNRRPAQILDAARKHEWEEALLWGWGAAAMRCQDAEWLEALIAYYMRRGTADRPVELFAHLPHDAQERLVIGLLRDIPSLSYDQPPSIYLSTCRHAWGEDLTQAVINAICRTLQKGEFPPWRWEKLLRDIPQFFHPDLLEGGAARIAAALERSTESNSCAAALAEALRFRHEMRLAFAASPAHRIRTSPSNEPR